MKKIGRNIPNTSMMGAMVRATGAIKLQTLLDNFKDKFSSKLRSELLEGNIEAIKEAHDEVRAE